MNHVCHHNSKDSNVKLMISKQNTDDDDDDENDDTDTDTDKMTNKNKLGKLQYP